MFDAQGNERTVLNSSQTVTGTVNYDAFGNTVGTSGSSGSSYMYGADSGYRNDGDAGLMHVGARYYDPKIGRFATRDTHLDQKPYLYCEHNPVNFLDPSGHDDWDLFCEVVGGGIGGLIGVVIGGGPETGVGVGTGIIGAGVGAVVGGHVGRAIKSVVARPVIDAGGPTDGRKYFFP